MTQSQLWLTLVVGLLVAGLLYALQPILTPFFVGMGLAYLADPFADRLEARGWSRTVSAALVFLVLIVVVVALLIGLIPLLVKQVQTLIQLLPVMEHWFNAALLPWLQANLNIDLKSMQLELVSDGLSAEWKQAGGAISKLVKYATQSTMGLVSALGSMALVPIVAFYLLRDFDLLTARTKALLPLKAQPIVAKWANDSNEVIAAFFRGQLMVMVSLAIIYALGLSFVGLNYALIIGVVAGLASIVPYLGFVVGIGSALLVAVFQFDSYWSIALVVLVFTIGQLVESFILTPMFVGDRIGLHPVAVIFAIMAGGQLFGFVGILLALPVAAVLMVALRHLHAGYVNSALYGEQGPE